MKLSKSKMITAAVFTLMVVITFGCGSKNDAPAPAPVPTTPVGPTTPVVPTTPTIGGSNCVITNPGGTALLGSPFTSALTSMYSAGYVSNDMISLTLFSQTPYANGYAPQYVTGTAAVNLPGLNQQTSQYPNQYPIQNQNTSYCANAVGSQPGTFDPSSGTVRVVLQGTNSVAASPYYPAQPQIVIVRVGFDCPAYLVPAYNGSPSSVQGCVSVQIGNQQPLIYQASGRLY